MFDGRDMEGGDESLSYPLAYQTHYPRTKAMAERRVRRAADGRLRTIALRPHLIWGPGDNHLVPRIIQRARRLRRNRGRRIAASPRQGRWSRRPASRDRAGRG
mgnify:CR=1 FL=1